MGIFTSQQLRQLLLKKVVSFKHYIAMKQMNNKNVKKRYKRQPFNLLTDITDEESIINFRFTKEEITKLQRGLRIPKLCNTSNLLSFTGQEGLCVLLRRLCYPNRLADLVKLFNREESALSRIFHWMLNFVYVNFKHMLSSLNQKWLSKNSLRKYSEACSNAGSRMSNICGFIDGTSRTICRPSINQQNQYSGYKKYHCIKFQSVVFPDGLIGRLDGPFNGRRHDAAILNLSGLLAEMRNSFINEDGSWFRLYGDAGYINSKFISVGYKRHNNLNVKQRHLIEQCLPSEYVWSMVSEK